MAAAYIGQKLSIVSKSNIRYEGVLLAVDLNAGNLSLSNGLQSFFAVAFFFQKRLFCGVSFWCHG